MLDLGSPDVWPSTREKAANWDQQSYVRKGIFTLWDAANLLDPEGYGGIYETCSKAVQARIAGLYVTLKQSLQERELSERIYFFGYAPAAYRVKVKTSLGVEDLPLYPGVAFLAWYEHHKRAGIDGRYFERYRLVRQDEKGRNSNSENPFWNYEGPLKMNKRGPAYWTLSRSKTMTVFEFVKFYCGIDLDSRDDESEEYFEFFVPLLDEIQKRVVELEDDVPF